MTETSWLWLGLILAWVIIVYLSCTNRRLREENYSLEKYSLDFELWKEASRSKLP